MRVCTQIHIDVQPKLIQHSKSATLQLRDIHHRAMVLKKKHSPMSKNIRIVE